MNIWKTADAVVRRLADGRDAVVDAPLEGGLEGLAADLRVRDDAVRRLWAAVSVAAGVLVGWGSGEGRAPSRDAYAGVRHEPTVLGLTVTHIANLGLDIPADAR